MSRHAAIPAPRVSPVVRLRASLHQRRGRRPLFSSPLWSVLDWAAASGLGIAGALALIATFPHEQLLH